AVDELHIRGFANRQRLQGFAQQAAVRVAAQYYQRIAFLIGDQHEAAAGIDGEFTRFAAFAGALLNFVQAAVFVDGVDHDAVRLGAVADVEEAPVRRGMNGAGRMRVEAVTRVMVRKTTLYHRALHSIATRVLG